MLSLAFGWVSPLLRRGAKRQLQFADLFELDDELQPATCRQRVWEAWSQVCTCLCCLHTSSSRSSASASFSIRASTASRNRSRLYLTLKAVDMSDVLSKAGPEHESGLMLTCLVTLLVEQERRRKDQVTVESGRLRQPSLLLALAEAYGRPYLLLGVLKLANDVLNFTGVQCPFKHQICCLLPCASLTSKLRAQ